MILQKVGFPFQKEILAIALVKKKNREKAKKIVFINYSNLLGFFSQISLITFICFFKKYKDHEEFFILGY